MFDSVRGHPIGQVMARCGIGKIILRSRRVWSRRCRAVAFGHPPVVHQRFQEVGQLAFFDPLMNILRSLRTQNCQSTRADGGKVYGCPSTSRSQGAPKFVFFGGSDLPLSLSLCRLFRRPTSSAALNEKNGLPKPFPGKGFIVVHLVHHGFS